MLILVGQAKVDLIFTEPHAVLRKLAGAYQVPAVIPHASDPEQYRDLIGTPSLAAEAENCLRRMGT